MIIFKNVRKSVIKVLLILLCTKSAHIVRSECSSSDWECDNGQCISDDKLCNGKVDCSDRSDEIAENCIQYHETCPKYAFRCAYGGCVDGKSRCNNIQDCADNSDELICVEKGDEDFRGTCGENEMQCLRSKQCINNVMICDGIANCQDGSDESVEVCINYICNPFGFGFQCGTGACISKKAKCNGKIECADGSDEAWQLCSTPRKKNNLIGVIPTPTPKPTPKPEPITPAPTPKPTPTPSSPQTPQINPSQGINCFLPNFPDLQNLRFKLHPQNQTIELGNSVEDYEILHIECKDGGLLRGQPSLICSNGEFNHDFPSCENHCDGKLLNRLSLLAICEFPDKFDRCPERIIPGTFIQVRCAYGYSREPNTRQEIKCLPNGNFDQVPALCEMNCGRVAPDSKALSKNGIEIEVSKAPWHVSIYEYNRVNYNYICGGSIISPTVVISAAHCFWDEANQVQKNWPTYQIIAGRSTSNYSMEQTEHSQLVKVKAVHIPDEYRGKDGGQIEDIAFMKLETPLKYSETIANICLSKDLRNDASKYMQSNRIGFINGFGTSNQLERVNMKTLAYHECILKSPADAPVAEDKFCVYTSDDALVCRGDSGGGFVIGKTDTDTGVTKYSLWGVISNTPNTRNDCTRTGDKAYVAITNIFHTRSSFKRKLANARKEDERLL